MPLWLFRAEVPVALPTSMPSNNWKGELPHHLGHWMLHRFFAGGVHAADLQAAAGELAEEVDGTGRGLADHVDERTVGVELYRLRLGSQG